MEHDRVGVKRGGRPATIGGARWVAAPSGWSRGIIGPGRCVYPDRRERLLGTVSKQDWGGTAGDCADLLSGVVGDVVTAEFDLIQDGHPEMRIVLPGGAHDASPS